jgi:hypothetical protein
MNIPSAARTPLIVLCAAALIIIGLLALSQSIGQASAQWGLSNGDGVVVEGEVVKAIQQPGSTRAPIGQPRGHDYCPEYRFETPEGDVHFLEVSSGCASDPEKVGIGHRAAIIYDPADPTEAFLTDGGNTWVGFALGGGAFLAGSAIVAALVVGVVRKRSARRPRR